jgi:hypothetical protein
MSNGSGSICFALRFRFAANGPEHGAQLRCNRHGVGLFHYSPTRRRMIGLRAAIYPVAPPMFRFESHYSNIRM